VSARAGPHAPRVRARVGLGEAEAADDLAPGHPWEPALLLLLGAELPDREHAERPLDAHERPEPAVPGLELQARQAVADGVRARALVAGEVHPEQPHRTELLGDFQRELPRLEPGLDAGEDALAHPVADGVADRALLVREETIEIQEIEGIR